jgi:LysR family transcriptional regulator, glycine cleavage system transcriptional activator
MKRDLPSLNAVRMFEAAARTQSFTRAATELHVTQGAVSRQIALLEEQLGCELFHRKGPQLKLSNAGLQYQSVVEEALETIRRGTAQIFQDNSSNILTVSILPSFASYWLMPRLPAMEKELPNISLRLASSHRIVDFAEDRDIDVSIRYGKGDWPEVYSKQITHDEMFPVCSPTLRQEIQCVEDLLDHHPINGRFPYDEWHLWFKKNNVKYQSRDDRTYDDTGVQIQAAIDGLGVILARAEFVKDNLQSGRLVRLFDSSIVSEFQYYFVCPLPRLSEPNIKAFHDWILSAG